MQAVADELMLVAALRDEREEWMMSLAPQRELWR